MLENPEFNPLIRRLIFGLRRFRNQLFNHRFQFVIIPLGFRPRFVLPFVILTAGVDIANLSPLINEKADRSPPVFALSQPVTSQRAQSISSPIGNSKPNRFTAFSSAF